LGLIILMVAMLPANISAARNSVLLRSRQPTPQVLRIPMQIFVRRLGLARQIVLIQGFSNEGIIKLER